jgi:tRNA threonylcarbamoyladenosine biosynthesis protein TsaB
MLLLAVDTSGRQGSIALARCTPADACEVIENIALAGGTLSAQLVPEIAALLAKHGFTKNDIEGFAAVSGPGSFTGLRVGLAAIKGLAEILAKPIAAVSLLEAVAVASGARGMIAAALDAGRGDVYLGEYEISGETAKVVCERLLTRPEFLAAAPGWNIVTPDKMVADAAQLAGVGSRTVEPPSAAIIARLGWRKIESGNTFSPEGLEANYLRHSDAEIFGKKTS